MEQNGVLRSWNDDKGFGFIRADDSDYFVHISSVRGADRPQQGETVFFVGGKDDKGRLRAQHMRSAELSIDRPATRRKPQIASTANTPAHRQQSHSTVNLQRTLSLLIAISLIPALGAWQAFSDNGVLWPLLIYVCMSLFSVLQYWCDKHNAQTGQWRIAEKQLHAVELFGGWPGAFLAQQLLRHKTQKASFQGVFWLIIALHQVYWLDQLAFSGQLLSGILNAI